MLSRERGSELKIGGFLSYVESVLYLADHYSDERIPAGGILFEASQDYFFHSGWNIRVKFSRINKRGPVDLPFQNLRRGLTGKWLGIGKKFVGHYSVRKQINMMCDWLTQQLFWGHVGRRAGIFLGNFFWLLRNGLR